MLGVMMSYRYEISGDWKGLPGLWVFETLKGRDLILDVSFKGRDFSGVNFYHMVVVETTN